MMFSIQMVSSSIFVKRPANRIPDFLSSLSFSPSKTPLISTADNGDDGASNNPYPNFRYTPHFGEPSRTKKRPTIFLFRWTRSSMSTRAAKQDMSLFALSLAQDTQVPVLFTQATVATDHVIFATGYEHTKDGRILGVKGCFNRPMGIWELRLPESGSLDGIPPSLGARISCSSLKLTPSERSCRSPRVLHDENQTPIKLFWLSNPIGGAHASYVSLESRDLIGGTNKVLVDTVMEPQKTTSQGYNMHSSPFLRCGDHV